MSLSKDQKKAMLRAYKEKQNKKYILKKAEAKSLFSFLRKKLSENTCDHTLRFSEEWITKKFSEDTGKINAVIRELQEDGGYCDCEVLLNCYERYELES